MEASASAYSNEAIDQILLKKIQTMLEKQSPSESEIDIFRKVIADQEQLGIVIYYFSLFPQYYVLDAERFIDLWIAEGFCNSSEDGRRCLSYLVGSSILQNVTKGEFGQVRSFRMHPRIHNIAKFVNSNRKNIMITKANPTGTNDDSNAVWRASFYSSNIPDELYSKAKQLKSIFFFNTVGLQEGKLDGILKKIFKNFKKLCVLDLHDLGIKDVSSSIGDLKDLEYLDLSENKMKKLPSSIAKLSKLHTLKLFECPSLKELPKDFKSLGKLKHLDMEGCRGLTGMPPDMSKLSSLQTLSAFVCFQGPSLPGDWLTSFKSLVKLSLKDCLGCEFKYLSKQDDQLPNLKILELVKLNNLEYITEKCNEEAAFYTSLEEMTIKDCNKLKSWWKNETDESPRPSFAKISKLHICRCPFLQTMPLYPHLHEVMVLHDRTLKLLLLNTKSIPLKNLRIQYCNDLTNLSGVCKHLSSLQCLTIEKCHELTSISDIGTLTSMQKLTLRSCFGLTSISDIGTLTSLQELTLENCHKLTSISDIGTLTSMQKLTLRSCGGLTSISDIGRLTSLQELTLENCHKLTSISDIGTLTSMQKLTLRSCGGLTSISDIGTLTSLQELTLENCPKLTSIPDGKFTLRSLEISECNKLESLPKTIFKSLQNLRILGCKLLQPMFVKNTGDYWSLSGDITDLQVKTTLVAEAETD